jgi:Family of unknown function (DUF6527)
MGEVKARRVNNFDEMKSPGDFIWSGDRMTFLCPCGCGTYAGIDVGGDSTKHPVWQWNQDRETPTVAPSILLIGGCNWHGHLTDGTFRSC